MPLSFLGVIVVRRKNAQSVMSTSSGLAGTPPYIVYVFFAPGINTAPIARMQPSGNSAPFAITVLVATMEHRPIRVAPDVLALDCGS